MSAARCTSCGFAHLPDDTARCRNARDVGVKLSRVLSIGIVPPSACTYARHEIMKQSLDAFTKTTRGWKESDDGHEVCLQGNCRDCDSTLQFFIRSSDARLKAAIELLKSDQ